MADAAITEKRGPHRRVAYTKVQDQRSGPLTAASAAPTLSNANPCAHQRARDL
ncbi:MAG: hypothetical protein WKG07_09540 [Hymenobacter sp.]